MSDETGVGTWAQICDYQDWQGPRDCKLNNRIVRKMQRHPRMDMWLVDVSAFSEFGHRGKGMHGSGDGWWVADRYLHPVPAPTKRQRVEVIEQHSMPATPTMRFCGKCDFRWEERSTKHSDCAQCRAEAFRHNWQRAQADLARNAKEAKRASGVAQERGRPSRKVRVDGEYWI